MERLRTKREIKFYDKLAKSVFARHNKFFRRNVHLNHKETYLKVLRIKNDDEFLNEVEGFKESPRDVCFCLLHINPLRNKNRYYNVKNTDYIITNNRNNRVISINSQPKTFPDFINIWIVRKNTINFLKVKLNDIFFTR